MREILQGPGLFGTVTSLGANATLVLSVLAAALFTVGWRLAVTKRFKAHRWVQTAAACLNAVLVFAWMIRAFVLYLIPGIPSKLGQSSYAVTTAHAVVGAIGLVLGGSQALSRSLYSQLVPRGREAEYFSLYQACERGTSWLGTLLFGLVHQFTGSYRWAIVALVVFFVVGIVLLRRVDVRRGIVEAGNDVPAVV